MLVSRLQVPKLLEPADLQGSQIDTKSVITYVAKLRQACLGLEESRSAEREEARLKEQAEER